VAAAARVLKPPTREINRLDLHPFAADLIHWRFAAMRDEINDPFA